MEDRSGNTNESLGAYEDCVLPLQRTGSFASVCSYSHRSYIVIDPSTCGAFPPSSLAKNFALRDTTCASKNP